MRANLHTRNGNDLTRRFPFIAMALAALPARSCLIDGEAIMCDETGLAVFDLIRGHRSLAAAVHCAFDPQDEAQRIAVNIAKLPDFRLGTTKT